LCAGAFVPVRWRGTPLERVRSDYLAEAIADSTALLARTPSTRMIAHPPAPPRSLLAALRSGRRFPHPTPSAGPARCCMRPAPAHGAAARVLVAVAAHHSAGVAFDESRQTEASFPVTILPS
jgi:hypothetical protein